jgi:hypothetical protein
MASIRLGLIPISVFLLPAWSAAQSEGTLADDLEQCQTITHSADRLACYDRVSKPEPATTEAPQEEQHEEQNATDANTTETAEPDSEEGALTDDTGLPKSADDFKPIAVTVTRCSEGHNRQFYFYFDNGQAWKYIGGKTLRYRDCDRPATLREDGLGFSLQLDGDEARLRVQRVR